MSQHYYADGAKHIDKHKEININLTGTLAGSEDAIAKLSKDFFADDDAEDATFDELEEVTTTTGSESMHEEIPRDCTDAVGKVLMPTFTVNSIVLNSQQKIIKGAEQINVTSNSEVAMLMAIGMEVNAVRSGVKCPDFVRALIGLGVISFVSKEEIEKMAGGMSKKIYGYKRGNKTYPPLPGKHLQWNTTDRSIGIKIYDAMTK